MSKTMWNKNFVLFVAALLITYFGDACYLVSFMWLAIELTDNVAIAGVVMAVQSIPMILLSPFAGSILDRMSKKRVLVFCDLVRVVILGGLFICFALDWINIWMLLIIAFLMTLFDVVYRPAVRVVIPQLVGGEHLADANSAVLTVQQGVAVFGNVTAGFLVAFAGVYPTLVIDLLTFLISAGLFSLIAFTDQTPKGGLLTVRSVLQDTMDGFRLAWQDLRVRTIIGIIVALNLAVNPVNVLLPAYAKEVLVAGADRYGLLLGAMALGMMVGAMITGKVMKRLTTRVTIWIGLGVMSVALFLMGENTYLISALLCSFAAGMCVPFIYTPSFTFLQQKVEPQYLGRVFGIVQTLTFLCVPIGSYVASAGVSMVGVSTVFVGVGIALGIVCLLSFFVSKHLVTD